MTRTDKLSSASRAKKFVKHIWKGKADKTVNQSVAPSSVNSGLALVASGPTQPKLPKQSTPSSPCPSEKLEGPGGLWDKAYQLVEKEDSELLACYERYILSTAGQSSVSGLPAEERAAELGKFASQKLKAVQEGDLKVIIHGKEIVVKEQIDRVIRCILAVKDVIREVLDNDPHGAIAWAGIVIILPVISSSPVGLVLGGRTLTFLFVASFSSILSHRPMMPRSLSHTFQTCWFECGSSRSLAVI